MDSRNAFERQLTDEIEYEVGPPQGVDAFAVTRQAKSTTPGWRFSMSSTLKFAAASVALAVAGTAIILAEPGGSGDGVAQPGAESVTSGAAQAVVTGSIEGWREVSPGTTTSDAELSRTQGHQTVTRWIASDPRLSGEETITANWDLHLSTDISVPEVGVGAMTRVLVNDDGRWVGETGIAFEALYDPGRRDIVVMRGEDAYEGLTAFILTDLQGVDYASFKGVIFEGEMPSFPELPAE